MAPFRKLLSPKEKFIWTSDLDIVFTKAKINIIEKVKEGVSSYDLNHITVLK